MSGRLCDVWKSAMKMNFDLQRRSLIVGVAVPGVEAQGCPLHLIHPVFSSILAAA